MVATVPYKKIKSFNFLRSMILQAIKKVVSTILIFLPLPFILILDIFAEIYHYTCFPLYGIQKVNRKDYIEIRDRSRLKYLSFWWKIGCMYCWYANGFTAYAKEIANRTEAYRCAIMHERKLKWEEHQTVHHFVPYGDEEKYKKNPKETI